MSKQFLKAVKEDLRNPQLNPKAKAIGEYLFSKSGRPPISGETATAQIQLRVTMARKNAYVRAARPRKLTEWIFAHLDRAAGYQPDR